MMRVQRCLASAILGMLLPALHVYAEDHDPRKWGMTATIGAVAWPDLTDIKPPGGGSFDSAGLALGFSAHRAMTQWGSADVLAGFDFGIFGTGSNITGTQEEFTQRGIYLTPSVKFQFGERDKRYLNLEAGAGWYKVDIAELDCSSINYWCAEVAEHFDKDTFGGYLGVSGGFGRWFVMGLKVHYADFGDVVVQGSHLGTLEGPIYIFSVGAAFGR
jgi:hypothetical protein